MRPFVMRLILPFMGMVTATYSRHDLSDLLHQAGFRDLGVMSAGTYGDAVFHGVDGHGKIVGEEFAAMEAFAIEARKPN
jgi:hypothetical protein